MKNIIKTMILFIVLLVATSCLSSPKAVIETSEAPLILKSDDGVIKLTHMTNDELIEQFGRNGNVFADFPAKIQPRRNIVFKLDLISNTNEYTLDLRNILLKIGDESSQSKYQEGLINSWSPYLQTEREKENAKELTEEFMHENKIRIRPGEPVSGLIVFLDKYPKTGESTMRLGLKDNEGNLIEIQFELDQLFMKETENK